MDKVLSEYRKNRDKTSFDSVRKRNYSEKKRKGKKLEEAFLFSKKNETGRALIEIGTFSLGNEKDFFSEKRIAYRVSLSKVVFLTMEKNHRSDGFVVRIEELEENTKKPRKIKKATENNFPSEKTVTVAYAEFSSPYMLIYNMIWNYYMNTLEGITAWKRDHILNSRNLFKELSRNILILERLIKDEDTSSLKKKIGERFFV